MVQWTHHSQPGLAGSGGFNFGPTASGLAQPMLDKGKPFYEQGLAGQTDAMNMWKQRAMGQGGPSAAEIAARNQGEANARMGMSLAGRSRGGNLAGAQQQAAGAVAGANVQNQQQLAALRAQEQLAAQQMYAQQAAQMSQQGFGYNQLGAQTLMGGEQNMMNWEMGNRQLDINQDAQSLANKQFLLGIGNSVVGAIGSGVGAGMMSDERVKKNIQPSGLAASEAIGATQGYQFEYEPGYGAPGQRTGLMAQDLERTPAGAAIVSNTPYGKAVDIGGLASLTAASQAETLPRIARLEAALSAQQGAGRGREMQGLATPPMGERDTVATLGGGSRPSIDAQLASEEDAFRRRQALERGAMSDPFGYSGAPSGLTGPSPVAFGAVGARMPRQGLTAIDPWGGR